MFKNRKGSISEINLKVHSGREVSLIGMRRCFQTATGSSILYQEKELLNVECFPYKFVNINLPLCQIYAGNKFGFSHEYSGVYYDEHVLLLQNGMLTGLTCYFGHILGRRRWSSKSSRPRTSFSRVKE